MKFDMKKVVDLGQELIKDFGLRFNDTGKESDSYIKFPLEQDLVTY